MKKVFLMLFACLTLTAFAACGGAASSASEVSEPNFEGNLEDYMTALYDGISEDNLPMLVNTEITAENVSMFINTEADFKDGLSSEPPMSAIAHSVCLFRAEDADKAAELATLIDENADPRKWICVEAEKKEVAQRGNLVLLVMTAESNADTILANFENLEA